MQLCLAFLTMLSLASMRPSGNKYVNEVVATVDEAASDSIVKQAKCNCV